jgi:hypothetical protein
LRAADVIRTGAFASWALRRARPDGDVSIEQRFNPARTGRGISGAIDISIK